MATSLSRIAQIALPARDIGRALGFYRDALGVRFLFEAPPKMAFFDCGGVRLLVGEQESALVGGQEQAPAASPGTVLYFSVDDIQAAQEEFATRGVRFVRDAHLVARLPDHELWLAFFEDTEGNTLALMEEKKA